MTVPSLEKESSGTASIYEIFATKRIAFIAFSSVLHCDSCFETSSIVENFFDNFLFNFVSPTLSYFSKTEFWARETFVNKIISSVDA